MVKGVKILASRGMNVDAAAKFLSQTYWCAFDDFSQLPKPKPKPEKVVEGTGLPYYDEYEIMFSLKGRKLSAEELKRDYVFCMNLYAKDDNIFWAISKNTSAGGPLHHFLHELCIGNNYAFGPTKAHRGFTKAKLAEMGAVGVYKRLPQKVKAAAATKPRKAIS